MKKAISILLAVIFAISLMPVALADSTATITAYNSSDAQVGTTYATIDAAAAAAGQNGKVCISAGVLEVNGRQTISVSGVTLEGAGRDATIIKPSASFASASETNRKALLTIAADNVTVKGLSLDGTDYGETVSGSTDFVASPVMPQSIAGIEKAASAVDVLEGKKAVGNSVVVVGGGMVGCETAVDLANHGKKVTLVEALDNILSSDFVPQQHSMMLKDLIEDRKIDVITGHKLVAVTDSGVEIEAVANGEKKTVSADTTVISVGLKPNPIDVSEFYGLGAQVYKIGSAKKAGNVIDAVGEAFEVVYNLD